MLDDKMKNVDVQWNLIKKGSRSPRISLGEISHKINDLLRPLRSSPSIISMMNNIVLQPVTHSKNFRRIGN